MIDVHLHYEKTITKHKKLTMGPFEPDKKN